MATSSATSSNNSWSQGCDEVPYCTKCQLTTDSIEAEKFCVDCSEYICTKCHFDHDKWSANKGHQIVEASAGIRFFGQKLSETCHLHKGLLIDMYCHLHDDVCCSTCAVLQHRSCHTESILQVSKGIKESNEYTAVFTTAEELLKKLAKSKAEEELIGLSIKKNLSSDITKVKEGRALIKAHFDNVEEINISLLSAVNEEKQKRAGQNIEIVDRLISSITEIRDGLTSKSVESDAAIFVKLKRGNA